MKITTKHASNSTVTFVTHKRFAVLFFLPSCCVNSLLLKMDLKLTYRLHGSGTNFWTEEFFYLCNSFTRNRANSVRDCSTVYKSPYENLHSSPGPVKTKNAGCVQVFVRSKNCPDPRVNSANSWWWLLVATLDVRAFVTFINLSAPRFYMYF